MANRTSVADAGVIVGDIIVGVGETGICVIFCCLISYDSQMSAISFSLV